MRLHGHLRVALICGTVLLAGCASTATMNVVSEGGDRLMLGGNDPVAYFAAGRAVPGRLELRAEHRGVVYRFASEDSRRAFITSPARYMPQYGGFCAARMAYAVPIPARNEQFKIIGGRLFVFSSARARVLFEMDQEKNLKLAEYYWDTEVKDANWHLQSMKRQFWHVPGYKSSDQLADEYEKRFGKRPG